MKTLLSGLSAAALIAGAALADELLLVVNKGEDTLALVDGETLEVTTTVPTGANPHEVYPSRDGTVAFVSDYGGAQGTTVTVIDLMEPGVLETWDIAPNRGPHGIWTSRIGGLVWVTTETSGTVTEIDVETGSVVNAWETGQAVSHQLIPTPDDAKLYIANIGSGSVTVITRVTGEVVSIPTGAGAEGIDISPDGSEVWVTNRGADTVSVIDVATDEVTASFASGGSFPIRARFTPDGSEVWISNAQSNSVAVIDAESHEILATIEVGAIPVGLQMDPEGERVFVANTQDDFVTVIDRAAREVTGRIETGDEPDGMAWVVR